MLPELAQAAASIIVIVAAAMVGFLPLIAAVGAVWIAHQVFAGTPGD